MTLIAVKEGNEDSEAIKALVEVLKSDEIKEYINETYDGAVIPFEDRADTAEEAAAEAEEYADMRDTGGMAPVSFNLFGD